MSKVYTVQTEWAIKFLYDGEIHSMTVCSEQADWPVEEAIKEVLMWYPEAQIVFGLGVEA